MAFHPGEIEQGSVFPRFPQRKPETDFAKEDISGQKIQVDGSDFHLTFVSFPDGPDKIRPQGFLKSVPDLPESENREDNPQNQKKDQGASPITARQRSPLTFAILQADKIHFCLIDHVFDIFLFFGTQRRLTFSQKGIHQVDQKL